MNKLGSGFPTGEIAETRYTAFASRRKAERVVVRLIVRRVKDKNVPDGQGELFAAWRYHAFVTVTAVELVQAEEQHREHADHRAGPRRSLRLRAGASALGIVCRERRLAHVCGDRP